MHKHAGKVVGKPIALSEKQRTRFAVKAILDVISKKPGRLDEKLAREMIGIIQGSSEVLKKKQDIHQVAMVNRYVECRNIEMNVLLKRDGTEGMPVFSL